MATEASQPRARAPRPSIGALEWLRQNLFSTWWNALISIILLFLVFQALSGLLRWVVTTEGWIAVTSNVRLLLVGRYPPDQLWRPELVVALIAVLLGLSGGVWRGIPLVLAAGFGVAMLALGASPWRCRPIKRRRSSPRRCSSLARRPWPPWASPPAGACARPCAGRWWPGGSCSIPRRSSSCAA